MIKWVYKCVELYDNRYKSYEKNKIKEDGIIYILLYSLIDKVENYNLDKYLENSEEINELKFENVKYVDLVNVIILKMINISIYYDIDEKIKHTENINKCKNILTELNKNDNILNQFEILKKYMRKNNLNLIKKYEENIVEIENKMNRVLMISIYNYYVKIMREIIKNDIKENSIFYSNVIVNILDYYIFYSKNYDKYVYEDINEKDMIFKYLCDIFNTELSNININIKLIDFYVEILVCEMIYIIKRVSENNDEDMIINFIKKLQTFYIELDNYDDFYKNNVKYRIISLFNNLFNKPNIIRSSLSLLIKNDKNCMLKFIINMYEMINVCMERYLSYGNNELYIVFKNQKNYYLIELMEYNLFLLKNYGDLIGDDIINIYVSKMNKILKSLDLNRCIVI